MHYLMPEKELRAWFSVRHCQIMPCRHLLVQSQQWNHRNNVLILFKVNSHKNDVIDVVLWLLLTLTRFYSLLMCFHCLLWTNKYRLVEFSLGVIYFVIRCKVTLSSASLIFLQHYMANYIWSKPFHSNFLRNSDSEFKQ